MNLINKEDLNIKYLYDQNKNFVFNISQTNKKESNLDLPFSKYPSKVDLSTLRSQSSRTNINNEVIKKKIILIADDNHIINNSNKKIVNEICKEKKLDYDIICCSDGIDILKFITDEITFSEVCIIITDENMEFLNGSEAIRIIRTIEERKKNSQIFIISLTSHEDISIINYIKESGADRVLTKPLSKNKLKELLEINSSKP